MNRVLSTVAKKGDEWLIFQLGQVAEKGDGQGVQSRDKDAKQVEEWQSWGYTVDRVITLGRWVANSEVNQELGGKVQGDEWVRRKVGG